MNNYRTPKTALDIKQLHKPKIAYLTKLQTTKDTILDKQLQTQIQHIR